MKKMVFLNIALVFSVSILHAWVSNFQTWTSFNVNVASSVGRVDGGGGIVNTTNTLSGSGGAAGYTGGVFHGFVLESRAPYDTIQFYDSYLTTANTYGGIATSTSTNEVLRSTRTITGLIEISTNTPIGTAFIFDTYFSSGINFVKTGTSTVDILYSK